MTAQTKANTHSEPQAEPFDVQNHGSIATLIPLHQGAVDWLNDNVDLDFNGPARLNKMVYMEPRYCLDLLRGYYDIE